MLKFLVTLLLALSLFNLAHSKNVPKVFGSEKRILDGTAAVAGQFKFMVGLIVDETTQEFLCGGFILNQHYIGTAAHCVNDYVNTTLVIFTVENDIDLNQPPTAAAVVIKAHVQALHPLFNINQLQNGHDVALLRTLSPIPLGANITAIKLATEVPKAGSILNLAGYGQTPTNSSGLLNWDAQPYVTPSDCNKVWNETFSSTLLLCAGGEAGKGSCEGDSGSALFTTSDINNPVDAEVVGIVSFGPAAGCGLLPTVYTNVPNFAGPWLYQAMASASYCPGDCIRAFRRCTGTRRYCRRYKQTCLAKCIFA